MSFRVRITRRAVNFSLLALVASMVACQSGTRTPPKADGSSPGNSSTTASSGGSVQLTGAGSTFAAPMLQRSFYEYQKLHPDVRGNYQSIGSGGGIKQFTDGTVDFGASDAAMTDEQIAKVSRGVLLVPVTAGSEVFAYNLPDVKTSLKLSRAVYSDIFLGKLTKWNDPKIAALNPGVKLPDLPITFVHRSDGSGTTFVFTNHMSAISPEWKQKVGVGTAVNWPVGVGGKGNEGVTAQIQQTQGAIGYIEYAYAVKNKIPFATLENKDGKYVEATPQTAATSLSQIKLPENFRAFEPDPSGPNSYPIVGFTWLLIYKTGYNDPKKLDALKDFIKWSLNDGQKIAAEQLNYVPIPSNISDNVKIALDSVGK